MFVYFIEIGADIKISTYYCIVLKRLLMSLLYNILKNVVIGITGLKIVRYYILVRTFLDFLHLAFIISLKNNETF